MQENIAPTKANLMTAQVALDFSKKGYELLDKKRNVLIREMMSFMDRSKVIQQKMQKIFKEAYEALIMANITIGINEVNEVAESIPQATEFHRVKYLLYELAEIEDSVYKLATEIKRTQKRTNALKNIQIPKYEALVKMISEMLEEKEREDFFRLKVLKKKKLR